MLRAGGHAALFAPWPLAFAAVTSNVKSGSGFVCVCVCVYGYGSVYGYGYGYVSNTSIVTA